MSPLARVFVVINLVLAIAFFGSSATLFATRVNWQKTAKQFKEESDKKLQEIEKKYREQGQRIVQIAQEMGQLKVNYNSLSQDKAKQDAVLVVKTGEISRANSRIETEVKEKTTLLQNHETLQKDHTELQRLLETARKESDDAKALAESARNEFTRVRLDLDKLNDEHSKTLIAMADLQKQADTNDYTIDALKKKGIDVATGPTAPPIDAVVQVVRPNEKLVVLSVGSEQKVKEGYQFTIYRGDRFVGKVQVIKVYPDLAGARILFTNENEMVQVGDKAATQL